MNLYATLDEYHTYKGISTALASLTSADKMQLLRHLRAASRRVDQQCDRHFYPLSATYYFDYEDAWEIRFRLHDLLEETTVATAGGDTTLSASDYDLLTGYEHNLYPKTRLRIRDTSSASLDIGSRVEKANEVTGLWGYHEDWTGDAWLSSLDTVQDAPLTAAATTITVADADGVNGEGVSPRFQVGQTLKIESEYCYVAAVSTAGNTLTAVRGHNGTTAAEHVATTAISVYQPMDSIREATLIIASYLEILPSAPYGRVQTVDGGYDVKLTIPEPAKELLASYERVMIGTKKRVATSRLFLDGVDPWRGDYG